jgi:hypothetical protein
MNFMELTQPVGRHTKLNPHLWDGTVLKPQVRRALLKIADDFLEFVDVPVEVLDIQITGGNANYTYTNKSDIDLHIRADYRKIQCEREAAELFDSKRILYKKTYDLKIYDIPVELYVEHSEHPAVSQGVYSILKNQWETEPRKRLPEIDQSELAHWVQVWRTILHHADQTADLATARSAMRMLRSYRKLGLHLPDKEFSIQNLVFKSLRNSHEIERLQTTIDHLHDQELSLTQ